MLRTILKSLKTKAAAVSFLAILSVPALAMAYGPVRPTFDYNKYDASDPTCRAATNDQGRCGSMNGPVFNSFINVPGYGDERNFALMSEAASGDANPIDNSYSDDLATEAGKEYWMRVYVHNNANAMTNNEDLNNDGQKDGVARNTRVKVSFVDGRANAHDVKATVTADNAATVWDEAVLRNNAEQFRLEYVAGSAKVLNAAQPNVLRPLSDEVAGPNGAQIGYETMNGSLPGCFEYVTRVYVKVKVKAPKILVKKYAYKAGTQEVLDGKTVAPNTEVTYKSYFFNIGNDTANDVTLRDRLAAGSTFVPGTLKLTTNSGTGLVQSTTNEDTFFNQGGVNFGNYAPLSDEQRGRVLDNDPANDPYSGLLTYRVNINNDSKICQLRNVVFGRVPGAPEVSDDSVFNIDRNGDKPGNGCNEVPPTPTPTPTPTRPTSLPSTGPGDVAGIFASVTVAGALAHRYILSRRYNV